MADHADDPTMPKRPPIAALRAIETIRAYRSWAPIEMYRAIRDSLHEPHEYPPSPGMSGSGGPPVQG